MMPANTQYKEVNKVKNRKTRNNFKTLTYYTQL